MKPLRLPAILQDARKPGVLLARCALLGVLISLPLTIYFVFRWVLKGPRPDLPAGLCVSLFCTGMTWLGVLWMGAGFYLLFDAVTQREKQAAVLPLRGRWLLYLLCALLWGVAVGMPLGLAGVLNGWPGY